MHFSFFVLSNLLSDCLCMRIFNHRWPSYFIQSWGILPQLLILLLASSKHAVLFHVLPPLSYNHNSGAVLVAPLVSLVPTRAKHLSKFISFPEKRFRSSVLLNIFLFKGSLSQSAKQPLKFVASLCLSNNPSGTFSRFLQERKPCLKLVAPVFLSNKPLGILCRLTQRLKALSRLVCLVFSNGVSTLISLLIFWPASGLLFLILKAGICCFVSLRNIW